MPSPGKIYYRIGEVAAMFRVKPSLIRYWEKEFDFIKPHKTKGGRRFFTQQDIERFGVVYHLIKEKGMTIQGTREYFEKYHNDGAGSKPEVIATLKKTKAFLTELRRTLENALARENENNSGNK